MLDRIISLTNNVAASGSLILCPLITSYYHHDIEGVFSFIEHHIQSAVGKSQAVGGTVYFSNKVITRSLKEILLWMVLLSCTWALYLAMPLLGLVLSNSDLKNLVGRLEHQLFGLPYQDSISSLYSYCGIYCAEVLLNSFAMIVVFSEPLLMITIAYELNNIVFKYWAEIELLGQLVADPFLCRRKNFKIFRGFDGKLKSLIQKYQVLIR